MSAFDRARRTPSPAGASVTKPTHKFTITDLVDRFLFGVILVDSEGRVMLANDQARRIFARADGIKLVKEVITPVRPEDRVRLSEAIGKAADPARAAPSAVSVGRVKERFPYAVLAVPLAAAAAMPRDVGGSALLLITDFDERGEVHIARLRSLFGLTEAEARLAAGIAQGKNLRQIAGQSGRSLATLRSQLATMFVKLGVKRQVDIARLVLSIPALRA